MEIRLNGGLDTGNGYMKGEISGKTDINVDYPSVNAIFTLANDIKAEGPAVAGVIEDIFNQMDISISSDLVPDGKRRIFGKRAINSGSRAMAFDVNSFHRSKAEQEMSAIMVLGTFAGAALKDFYETEGKLPEKMLSVKVSCALALPVSEYREFKNRYSESFMKGSHLVTFHNFVEPVRAELVFENVLVFPEGAAAHYAIASGMAELDKALNAKQKNLGITARMVQDAENIIIVDIGEGTVNFVVFQGGELSPDASGALDQGYGTMLDQCVNGRLKDSRFPFQGRKMLADFLIKEPSPLNRAKYEAIREIIDDEGGVFSEEIVLAAENYISRIGSGTEVIVVLGGGSIPLRRVLEPKLLESGDRLSGIPVVYISSDDARRLNAKGLRKIAQELFGKGKVSGEKK